MFTKLTVLIMMYITQIIILYMLNLYRAVCKLFLDKAGRKKDSKKGGEISQDGW